MAKIRDLVSEDIPALTALLAEGFPLKTPAYWQNALAVLGARPRLGELPQYGLGLEVDGTLQGVMLMIAGQRGDHLYCNLSSWYVREDHRTWSVMLFQRAMRRKGVCYTDCSPAEHVLPVITKLGFQPYTGGSVLIDARAALRGGDGVVQALDRTALDRLDPPEQSLIRAHLEHGCAGVLVTGPDGRPHPALYRTTRLKRLVPAARFVSGPPEVLMAAAGGLMRALVRRGLPLMLIDLPTEGTPSLGRHMPGYGIRYARGGPPLYAGDLLDTEIAVFGL